MSQHFRTVRRALARRMARRRIRQRGGPDLRWTAAGAVVLCVAGALFAATARTAEGTSLRAGQEVELREFIPERDAEVGELEHRADRLRSEVDELTARGGDGRSDVERERERGDRHAAAAGLTAVHGPGVTVSLNDAPRTDSGELPAGATVDDVVVHQQDVQAVVNALWQGGAEAMTIMGVRVVSTSAVRCVGNTLLLHGRVYSPPFRIAVIGSAVALDRALRDSPGVRAFRGASEEFGLGYEVRTAADLKMPAFDGSVRLSHAHAPR